jgi:hypothetical protein
VTVVEKTTVELALTSSAGRHWKLVALVLVVAAAVAFVEVTTEAQHKPVVDDCVLQNESV